MYTKLFNTGKYMASKEKKKSKTEHQNFPLKHPRNSFTTK